MIPILYVLLGIFFLARKQISISGSSEIRRPGTTILGVATILTGVLIEVIARATDKGPVYTISDLVLYVAPLIIPIIAAVVLKKPKSEIASGAAPQSSNKLPTIIGWIIIALAVIGFAYVFLK